MPFKLSFRYRKNPQRGFLLDFRLSLSHFARTMPAQASSPATNLI